MNKYPYVTFIVPTLNAERYLDACLSSIRKQKYPKNKYELFLVDGGSKDNTLSIAKKYKARVVKNKFVDQESGKSLGIQKSKGEIIVLMDADNEIVKNNWLKKMVDPFNKDPELFGVESYYFYKKGDSIFNIYGMILHIADPFSRMIAARLAQKKKRSYIECTIPEGQSYPLGANGFLWNKRIIKEVGKYKPMFEESNFSYFAMEAGYRKFARVPGYGIYHYHTNSISDFLAKRLKIGNKFLNRKDQKRRTWLEGVSPFKFAYSYIYCLTFIGPTIEAIYEYLKTEESAWLLHPFMSFLSVATYTIVYLRRRFAL